MSTGTLAGAVDAAGGRLWRRSNHPSPASTRSPRERRSAARSGPTAEPGHQFGGIGGAGGAGAAGPNGRPRREAVAAYLRETNGDLELAARLYADAARNAPNFAERDHQIRGAARLDEMLRHQR